MRSSNSLPRSRNEERRVEIAFRHGTKAAALKNSVYKETKDSTGEILDERKLNDFKLMGFTNLEAKTYVKLLKTGPCNARTMTILLGVNRVDVYRTLRSLIRRGLVETAVGNPTTYVASPPDVVMRGLVEFQEQKLISLKSRMKDMETWLSSIQGIDSNVAEKSRELAYTANFVVRASNRAFEHHQRILQDCKDEVMFVWSSLGLEMHYTEGTLDVFEACKKRGVRIHGVVEEKAKYTTHHDEWSKCVEFRYVESIEGMLRYIIIDGSELILAVNETPRGIDSLQSLSTRNATIIKGFERAFDNLWNTGSTTV